MYATMFMEEGLSPYEWPCWVTWWYPAWVQGSYGFALIDWLLSTVFQNQDLMNKIHLRNQAYEQDRIRAGKASHLGPEVNAHNLCVDHQQ